MHVTINSSHAEMHMVIYSAETLTYLYNDCHIPLVANIFLFTENMFKFNEPALFLEHFLNSMNSRNSLNRTPAALYYIKQSSS